MKHKTAKDVMNPDVISVPTEMTVKELVDLLAEKEITGVPVVDTLGHFVGVVSVTDVAEAHESGAVVSQGGDPAGDVRGWEERMSPDEFRQLRVQDGTLTVGDIMTPTVYTVPEETPVAQLARTMVAGRIHRLFVTHRRKIVGIVTSLDLLQLLAEDAD
jgi:CBS domain-containing protein